MSAFASFQAASLPAIRPSTSRLAGPRRIVHEPAWKDRLESGRGDRAVSKKWYNYFVVTTPDAAAPAASSSSEPARVVDVVPDAASDAMLTEPLAGPVDLTDIYRSAQIPTPAHGYTVLKVAEM